MPDYEYRGWGVGLSGKWVCSDQTRGRGGDAKKAWSFLHALGVLFLWGTKSGNQKL